MSQTPTPAVSPTIMQVRDLGFAYRDRVMVVDGVTVDVRPGRLCALIGPNGSGKTTLLKLMLGLLSPTAGQISLRGEPIGSCPASKRAAWLSYVPQRSGVSFAFTVKQVVAMGRYALPADDHAVAGALGLCDLKPLADRPYTELSVGQQQRVLLARAMVQSAGQGRVILLDEPTSAMDLAYVHTTMRQLRDLADSGMAVIIVVQDLNLAARYADDVWLMDDGRLASAGAWSEVLRAEVLQPVYNVRVRPIVDGGGQHAGRPIFSVELRDG